MVSEARKLSIKNYRQEKRDQLAVDVPKGKRDEYKQKAASLGLSLSMLIQHSVESYGANHAGEEFKTTTPAPMTTEERKILEEVNALPDDTRKALLKLVRAINQSNEANVKQS